MTIRSRTEHMRSRSLLGTIDAAALFVMRLGGGLILLSALMVTTDVVARKLFSVSLAGLDEISGYFFGISTAAAFSACLIRRTNIRIDGAYRFMPLPLRVAVDFLAIVALTAFLAIVTWVSADLVMSSYTNWSRSISPMQTPLFVPQIVWISFLGLSVVTGVGIIGVSIGALLKSDWARLQSLIGPLSLDEEIGMETESLNADAAPHADKARR